jgi:hypothetical protein
MCRVSARRLSIYNFAWELLKTRNLQAESKILKYWNIKSTNQNEIFPKKVCLVPQTFTGAKNSYRGYPTEFASLTQNP